MMKKDEQIRKTAIKLFNKYGFKGTSVERISKAVGLKKGSLYHHIESKNDLLFDVFREAIEGVNAGLKKIVDSDLPPDQKLRKAIENHIEKQIEYFDEYRLYLQERNFLPRKFESEYKRKRKLNQKYFESIITQGIKDGFFSPDIDAKATTLNLFGMLNWMTQWYQSKGSLTPEEISRSIWELTMFGIKSAASSNSRGKRNDKQ